MNKSNKEVIQLLKSNIEQGIYCPDQQIVTQKFHKPFLRNGKTVTERVLILGRNVALTEICKVLQIDHKEYVRLKEIKRFIKSQKNRLLKSCCKMINKIKLKTFLVYWNF